AAVFCNGHLTGAIGVAQPEIAVTVERLELAVGRQRETHLPPALRRAGWPPALRVIAQKGIAGCLINFARLCRRNVVTIGLAVLLISERLAAVLPFDGERARLDR